ncbi:MAG: hypothetical protein IJJ25_09345 [Lachnospiraceae bacterium]|nr:hypothetical protein [Lachnospiraceae bacterium]
MKYIGLDIGTTTISAAVIDCGASDIPAQPVFYRTVPNNAALSDADPLRRIQDPGAIIRTAADLLDDLLSLYPEVSGIGITGQQHGILYTDKNGDAVSPLYTWQDKCADNPFQNETTYAAYLTDISGAMQASGYGNVTHFYQQSTGCVPQDAAKYCTVPDYFAMKITGRRVPAADPSMSASLGMYDLRSGDFMRDVMEKAGFDLSLLPEKATAPVIGYYRGIPVTAAIGDNQASFIGGTEADIKSILVNVGTGSQISIYTEKYMECSGLETRPFPLGGYLIVGASLCGGRAYALLNKFFEETALMLGTDTNDCYANMAALLEKNPKPQNIPVFDTRFQGTRTDPTLKGSITGLDANNFHPLHFIYGMLDGISSELFDMFTLYRDSLSESGSSPLPASLYGSGGGLRKNPALIKSFEEHFGLPLHLSAFQEEAASGAAVYASLVI